MSDGRWFGVTQLSLFGPKEEGPEPKPVSDQAVELQLLITVKAAPNPSERYGETVCVAGLSVDWQRRGWIRLYPINFRELASDDKFRKYDLVTVAAKPARQDQRRESFRPMMDTMVVQRFLPPWKDRRGLLDPYVEDSMCRRYRAARDDPNAQSLALVRPRSVDGLDVEAHPGWTPAEQRKIDAYIQQPDLFSGHDRTALLPPRFRAFYRYRCHDTGCGGHCQGVLDWELVSFQCRLADRSSDELRRAITAKFLEELCGPGRDVAFYVGNQAKRAHVFSVLGVYWPPRASVPRPRRR
ncbi:hypothetical protein [Actinoplanes subglobosus]|uniref:Uncharacterized protein n=1 Tax=Actinoplanes subglobosus TaxID=1547892 RepID=A0ABV8IS39_9ACTN